MRLMRAAFLLSAWLLITCPFSRILPEVTGVWPVKQLSKVDLPAPLARRWGRLFLPYMLEAEGQAIQDANQQVTSAEIVEFILALVMLSSLDQKRG